MDAASLSDWGQDGSGRWKHAPVALGTSDLESLRADPRHHLFSLPAQLESPTLNLAKPTLSLHILFTYSSLKIIQFEEVRYTSVFCKQRVTHNDCRIEAN